MSKRKQQPKPVSDAKSRSGRYRFVPAGYAYSNYGGLGIYVRHHRWTRDSILVREHNASYTILECPDRDLVLVKHDHQEPCYRPTDENYDHYVPLTLFDPYVAQAFNLDFAMTNYVYTEQTHVPYNRSLGRREEKRDVSVLTDCGGFQLSMQKIDFVDPSKLIKHYNENSDIGMVLDLPPWGIESQELMDRLAKVQALNTSILVEGKRDNLHLMNVMHGTSIESRTRFRKIVERPDITRVSFGGTQDGTLTGAIHSTLQFILTGQKYEHYHALGVYNIPHLLSLVRIAHMPGNQALITSDASTPVMSSNYKMYHHQQHQDGPARRVMIGDKNTFPNVHNLFPCQCPVCSTIKYVDVLSVLDGATFRHLLMLHNVWEINRYARAVDSLSANMDNKQYRELIRSQLRNHRDKLDSALTAIDFVHAVTEHGLEGARKKYAAHLVANLFTSKTKIEEDVWGAKIEHDETQLHEHAEFLDKVVSAYERRESKEGKKGKGRTRKFTAARLAKVMKVGKKATKSETKKGKKKPKKEKADASKTKYHK